MGGLALVAVLQVLIAVSIGALVFSGDLSGDLAAGVVVGLVGSVVLGLVIAWRSSLRGTVAVVQDGPAVVLAVMAADVASTLREDGRSSAVVPTVLLMIAGTTAVTGIVLWMTGRLHLGRVVRYLPAPVVGGFLTGTGLLLLGGAVQTMAGVELTPATVDDLVQGPALVRWLPGLLVGIGLLALVRRTGSAALIPVGLLVLGVGFHLVLLLSGVGLDEAAARGLLPQGLPPGPLWRELGPVGWQGADVGIAVAQVGGVLVVVLLAAVSVLLQSTALEAATGTELDVDAELVSTGQGNLLSGLLGGGPGYAAVSTTLLARRLGAGGSAGWVAAAACAVVLATGTHVLQVVPLAVVGAVLALLGADFVLTWTVDTRARTTASDLALVLVMTGVIVWQGFLAGVAAGLVGALVLFVGAYSRRGVVRVTTTAAALRSRVDRTPEQAEVLDRRGGEVLVLVLQGYLFFGSAHALLLQVRGWLAEQPAARAVVLDLGLVSGLDAAATGTVLRVRQALAERGAQLLLCSAVDRVLAALQAADPDGGCKVLPDLDRALQTTEDAVLEHRPADSATPPRALLKVGTVVPTVAGDVLLSPADGRDVLLYVVEGTATAWAGPPGRGSRVRTVAAGSYLGEIAFFRRVPHTATVVADGPGAVLVVDRAGWERLPAKAAGEVQTALIALLALRLATIRREADALLQDGS